MAEHDEKDVLRSLGGSAEDVVSELQEFSNSARILSSNHPRLIDEHPLQWVGVFDDNVAASATSLEDLMEQLKNEGIPPEKTIVRFIDKDEKTLIL